MTKQLQDRIRKLIRDGYRPKLAKCYAQTDLLWDRLEEAGLVRLGIIPDEYISFDDLAGDCFDEELNKDVPGGVRAIRSQRKAFERRIERDGVWGVVGFYRLDPSEDTKELESFQTAKRLGWIDSDAVWGFVGDDWEKSGYDSDIKAETIQELRNALKSRCPTCREVKHV